MRITKKAETATAFRNRILKELFFAERTFISTLGLCSILPLRKKSKVFKWLTGY